MKTISAELISNKKVLVRYDIDVPLKKTQDTRHKLQVIEDFRLKAGLKTLHFCLEHASQVILMGHIGRPEGKEVPDLSVAPIYDWLIGQGMSSHISSGKLKLLENLRFEQGEDSADSQYAHQLAKLGDIYINEAFASYHSAASTTVLPTLLPHAAGFNFSKEVEVLTRLRENPKKPFVAIMGGAKVEDKLPVIKMLAQKADAVLVGGKLVHEINEQKIDLPKNVMVGKLKEDGFDIAPETLDAWKPLIAGAKMIVWNGPVGKFEDPQNDQSFKLAQIILDSPAETIIGGGDTVSLLGGLNMLEKSTQKGFVSSGGGAMLKFLSDGTLPTIEALN